MNKESQTIQSFKQHCLPWMVCITASLFFFYEFIQGNMFASIADEIMRDFHVQADKMTYLSSIYYLSNVIFLFIAGVLLDRYSTKKITLIAMVLCVASTFVLAHAEAFYVALGCRFVTGIGSAFCFLGPVRIASRWFPPKKMALVTGMIVTIAMFGGMVAQYPLTALVVKVGWRTSLVVVAWVGVIMALMMAFWVQDKPANVATRTKRKLSLLVIAKKAYLNAQTWRAALYASLMNMAVAVFGAMMGTLYLIQRLGVSKEEASIINMMLFVGAVMGGPIMGFMSDRLGVRVLPMKIGALLSLAVMLTILYMPVSSVMMGVLFMLLGVFTASQVISYALVAESSLAIMTASAVSIVSILTQGGYVIYQNLFSNILSQQEGMQLMSGVPIYSLNAYQSAAVILPIGLVLAFCALFGLKETYCRAKVEDEIISSVDDKNTQEDASHFLLKAKSA